MTCTTLFAGQCARLSELTGSKKVKKTVEIWMRKEQQLSMSRSLAAESEQMLGLVRRALSRGAVVLTAEGKVFKGAS